MEKQQERTPINGNKAAITKKAIGFGIVGILGTTVVYLGIKLKRSKKQTMKDSPPPKKELRFVFFSPEGLPITLSEQEAYKIKQLYIDGVLPTTIAKEHNMSTAMVFRIIGCLKQN